MGQSLSCANHRYFEYYQLKPTRMAKVLLSMLEKSEDEEIWSPYSQTTKQVIFTTPGIYPFGKVASLTTLLLLKDCQNNSFKLGLQIVAAESQTK